MAQFVRIHSTFINLDTVRTVLIDPTIPEAIVVWTAGDSTTYSGEQATRIVNAMNFLSQISLAVPNPPDEPV